MGEAAKRLATYADIEALPPNLVGEIIDGELHTMSRPAPPHANASMSLGAWARWHFNNFDDGGGGWWIVAEPELHLSADTVVPDIAGWRKSRMPEWTASPFLTAPPDWVCEVLSPSTERFDRVKKMKVYADHSVGFTWLVKPSDKSLEVFKLQGKSWLLLSCHVDDEVVRVPPFEEVELKLGRLWVP